MTTLVKVPRSPTPAASDCPALRADLAADSKGCRSGRVQDEFSSTLLVVALGNPLLGDEGVGLRALQALASAADFAPSVELLDGGTAGMSLVPRLRSADKVLVLDAVSAGKPPGTVMRLDGAELVREGFGKTSAHQIGLGDILSAIRLSGGPEEVVILGVEPESLRLGVGLSAPVEKAVEKLVAAALRQLREWEESECTRSR